MSDNYIIEIRPAAAGVTVQAGIVVRDGSGFRFFAASGAFNCLDGQLFASPRAAERVALCRVTHKTSPGRGAPPRAPSDAASVDR